MKFLRWAAASLLGLVGLLLAVLGGLLTGTLILAPIGIPLLLLARQTFRVSGRLVIPRAVRHPLEELDRAGSEAAARGKKSAKDSAAKSGRSARKSAKKSAKKSARSAEKVSKRARRLGRRRRGPLDKLSSSVPGS